jgi:hypothetical protein
MTRGGKREGAGRPSLGLKPRTYKTTEKEDKIIKRWLKKKHKKLKIAIYKQS